MGYKCCDYSVCMIWSVGGWCLLLLHFFFPEPYREQILASQLIISTFAPKLMSFHMASILTTFLYVIQTGPVVFEWSPFILHHLMVFTFVMSEYYYREWRFTCACVLFWSVRWMNSNNIYSEHPSRGLIRCILFAFVTFRHFSSPKAIRWSWIFFVHEFCYICVPIQMLYEVYFVSSVMDPLDIV